MNLRPFAIYLVVVLLVTLRLSTASDLPAAKPPVLDADGCIDGKRPIVLELDPGNQMQSFGFQTSLAELKKAFDTRWTDRVPPEQLPPVLIVADDNIPESRVTELFKLCADYHLTRIVRVKSYPDNGVRTTAANPALASPSVQTEKFRLITSEAGLTFPPPAQIVEFYGTEDTWWAKIMIPEASFAEFKETVLKKGDSAFHDDIPGGGWRPRWWNPAKPEFRRLTIGSHFVFSVETVATKENGEYVICMACECH
jgi:hypothetical protein